MAGRAMAPFRFFAIMIANRGEGDQCTILSSTPAIQYCAIRLKANQARKRFIENKFLYQGYIQNYVKQSFDTHTFDTAIATVIATVIATANSIQFNCELEILYHNFMYLKNGKFDEDSI